MSTCIDARSRFARRRRARGVIALEGLIVVLFMLIPFFGVVAIGGLYRAKLRVLQDARFRNTLNATNSCTIDGERLLPFPLLAGYPPIPVNPIAGLQALSSLGVPGMGSGVSRARAQTSFGYGPSGEDQFGLRVQGNVSAQSVSACNPRTVELEPLHMLEQVGLRDEMETVILEAIVEPMQRM